MGEGSTAGVPWGDGPGRALGITVWTYIRTGYNAEVVNLAFSGNKLVKIELNLLKL